MSDDNKEKSKVELKHHEDENSKISISKQDIEELLKDYDTSELAEILEDNNIPRKMKKRITQFMSVGRIPGSFLSPVESKINEKHIDKILDIKGKYEDNIFRDTQSSRKLSNYLLSLLVDLGLDTELNHTRIIDKSFSNLLKLYLCQKNQDMKQRFVLLLRNCEK